MLWFSIKFPFFKELQALNEKIPGPTNLVYSRYADLPSNEVSRIWREVHAFLAHLRIHAAFLKIHHFHAFSGFSSRIHPKFCTISSNTDFLVCIFLLSIVLTESSTNSRTMSRQIVLNTKHNLLLGLNIEYFRKEIGGNPYGPEEKFAQLGRSGNVHHRLTQTLCLCFLCLSRP